jgi:hypothetical protein
MRAELTPRGFVSEPRPEIFHRLANFHVVGTIIVGVKIIEADAAGLKIVPTAQIVFELDEGSIDLPTSMVRELIPRLQSMCDAADALNTWHAADALNNDTPEDARNGR